MKKEHKQYLSDTDQSGRTTERYLGPDAQEFDDNANLAEEFAHAHADSSHINRYVADHGEAISPATETEWIERVQIRPSQEITRAERCLIADEVKPTQIQMKDCFGNALRMWEQNPRFNYAEGFGVLAGGDDMLQHAWCMLDGDKLVDFTPEFEHHYGVIFTDDSIVEEYGPPTNSMGIIGDRSNHYEFLRDRGYYGV